MSRTDVLGTVAQTTSYGYGPVGSPGALELQTETQPLASIAYGYDQLGRLSSRQVSGNGPETFAYDTLGRLMTHASDLGSFTLGYSQESGQITSRVGAKVRTDWTYQPNAADQRMCARPPDRAARAR